MSYIKLQSVNKPLAFQLLVSYRFSNNLIAVVCAGHRQTHTHISLAQPNPTLSPHSLTFIFIDTTTLILSEPAVVGSSNWDV